MMRFFLNSEERNADFQGIFLCIPAVFLYFYKSKLWIFPFFTKNMELFRISFYNSKKFFISFLFLLFSVSFLLFITIFSGKFFHFFVLAGHRDYNWSGIRDGHRQFFVSSPSNY